MDIISNIFQMEHSSYLGLIPIKLLQNEDIEEIIRSYSLDINKFYKVEDKLYPYCYMNETVLVEIYEMSKEFFKNFQILERIKQAEENHKECIENNDYERLFCLIDKPYRFSNYQKLFDKIPDNQKYEVFIDIYATSEYGFNELDREFIEMVFSYNKVEKNWFNEDIITIYRGEGSRSTPYNKAYSWTTNIKVAEWFANRFNSNGKVYKGKVKQSDILDYLKDRNEEEILVFPEDVFDIELL